jgi:hypothetical protein
MEDDQARLFPDFNAGYPSNFGIHNTRIGNFNFVHTNLSFPYSACAALWPWVAVSPCTPCCGRIRGYGVLLALVALPLREMSPLNS